MIIRIKNVMVVAAVVAAMLVGVAQAAEADAPVRFEDLNLSSDAGVQVLYKRIQTAARQVCGDVYTKDLQVARVNKTCVEQAVTNAVAAVNNQMLTKTVTVAQVR